MGKPIVRREQHLLLYSSCNTVVLSEKGPSLYVFGEG